MNANLYPLPLAQVRKGHLIVATVQSLGIDTEPYNPLYVAFYYSSCSGGFWKCMGQFYSQRCRTCHWRHQTLGFTLSSEALQETGCMAPNFHHWLWLTQPVGPLSESRVCTWRVQGARV